MSMNDVNNIHIFITDDHPLVIEGMVNMLAKEKNIRVIGSASNGAETIIKIEKEQPDIVFLDINLPDINGIEVCRRLKQQFPKVKCIALSTFNENSYISRMIGEGAVGYLLKNSSKEEILKAIHSVYNGNMHLNVDFSQKTERESTIFVTRREKEVLELIAEGKTNQEIADQLFISVTTVNTHRKNLLMKFEVNNTAALIKQTVKAKII